MTAYQAFQYTVDAINNNQRFRVCECPAHITGRCHDRSCCCLRHRGLDCLGIIPLDKCAYCKGPVDGDQRVILECGCIHCEHCAVDALLSKQMSRDKTIAELVEFFQPDNDEQAARISRLIRQRMKA